MLEDNSAVVADVRAKPGCEHYLQDLFSDAVEDNRENGTALLYRLHVDLADKAHLMFYEIWRDGTAVDAYQASESFQGLLARAMPATASVCIYRLRTVAE